MSFANHEPDHPRAISALYRGHSAWLRIMLRRSSTCEGTDDVVQETFSRLATNQSNLQLSNPRAFLLKIAQNILTDKARERATQKRRPPQNIIAPQPIMGSTEQFETVLLKQVVLSLPDPLREVFVLSRFGGLTYEEIGMTCGITAKAVEARMAKALAHCAAKLRE